MPIPLYDAPDTDMDHWGAGLAKIPVPEAARYGAEFGQAATLTGRMITRGASFGRHLVLDTLGIDPSDPVSQERPFGDIDSRISADEANRKYGLDKALRFNAPVEENDAAWQSAMAWQKAQRDSLYASTKGNPLLDFGASLGGSLIDPGSMALMALGGPLARTALEATGLRGAALDALAVSKVGRVANVAGNLGLTAAEGALANTPFAGANAWSDGGDDWGATALRDIAAGAVLHTTLHLAGQGAGAMLRAGAADPNAAVNPEPVKGAPPRAGFHPDPVPASGVPAEVDALPTTSRQGAFALALDQAANGDSVDVGELVARELEPPGIDRLNEADAEAQIPSWRPLAADTAVTPRGSEIPVRYGLAELDDLVTSHDDNLGVNPSYPPELQPRARERAGAMARNCQLEQELNPRLLMNDVGAGSGAPIVAPDGVVESGNGRTIALRRSAASDGAAYDRYDKALVQAGYDLSGMKRPVLVRMRDQALTGAQRAALAREMNADVTERMGAVEQAQLDAGRISDAAFDQLPETSQPWASRDFARDFIARAAPDQANVLANADGSLSPEGARRIKAAVLQRAYEDVKLTAQVLEDSASELGKAAEALADAAPMWARMRAAARMGAIPRALDLTENLVQALDLARWAKAEGRALPEVVRELEGQGDIFSGSALSADTLKMLRMMFGDSFAKLDAKLAGALKDYARQALKVAPGKDLFGKVADIDTARQILANVAETFRTGDAGPIDIVRPPGPSRGAAIEAGPVIDLSRPEAKADGEEGAGEKPAKVTADQIIAADPELRELLKDTERLEAENGITPEIPEAQDPNTLAEAIRAAAVCLAEES